MRERQWNPKLQIALVTALVLASACSSDEGQESGTTDVCGHPSHIPSDSAIASSDIAYGSALDDSADLWLMRPDGSRQASLVSGEGLQVMPAWSPGGGSLAYTGGAAEDLESAQTDICRISLEDGRITNLTGTEDSWESMPSWSPDGRHLAYASGSNEGTTISIMGADGSDRHSLLDIEGSYTWPTWSPDGRRIAFAGSLDPRSPEQIWVVGADGGDPQALTAPEGYGTSQPSWSPNGELIAYVSGQNGDPSSDDERDWNEDVYVMNADGSDPRQVTSQPGNDHWPPAWSPDSSELLYSADSLERTSDLYRVPLDDPAALPMRGVNLTNDSNYDGTVAWRTRGQPGERSCVGV
jgi:Tol biopolymer transport system component